MASVFGAIAAVSSGVSAGAATVSAGGGLAAAGTAATGAGLTLTNVMTAGSALAAVGSGIMSIKQGYAQADQLKTEAAFAGAAAEQERAAGASQALDLAREYAALTSEQTVVQLANGLDVGTGTPVNIRESTKRQADRSIDTTRENARNRSAMQRLRQRGLMTEARAAISGGYGQALKTGFNAYQLLG